MATPMPNRTFHVYRVTATGNGNYTINGPSSSTNTYVVYDAVTGGDSANDDLTQIGDISNDHFEYKYPTDNTTLSGTYVGRTADSNTFVGFFTNTNATPPTKTLYAYTTTLHQGDTIHITSAALSLQGTFGPILKSASVKGTSLTLTYDKTLDGANPPPASAFQVKVNNATDNVTAVTVSGTNVVLTLATGTNVGQTVTVSYTDPSAGNDAKAIQDTSGNDAASLSNQAVKVQAAVSKYFHNYYLTKNPNGSFAVGDPLKTGVTVYDYAFSGETNDDLTQLGDISPDKYKELTPANVQLNGTYVAKTSDGQSFVGKYSAPAANKSGYYLYTTKSYSNGNTVNVTGGAFLLGAAAGGGDTTPPTLASASVTGDQLTLTYSEPLDTSNQPSTNAFSVITAGAANPVTDIFIKGSTITLTLTKAVLRNQTVLFNYTDPSAANDTFAVQDTSGNDAASISNYAVTNVTPDIPPTLTGLTSTLAVTGSGAGVTPVLIDSNVTFTDPDLKGGKITVSGLLAEDRVGLTTDASVSVNGSNVSVNGTLVGTTSGGSGTTFTITLNGSATGSTVDTLLQHLNYMDAANTPTASRTLSVYVTDDLGVSTRQETFSSSPDGSNRFSGISPGLAEPIAFGNLSGDSRPELVVGQDDGTLKVYTQNVSGMYVAAASNPFSNIDVGIYSAPALGDIDGDGRLDLVVGGQTDTSATSGTVYTYLQNSNGTFSSSAAYPNIAAQRVAIPALGDFDGDGDVDLVIGGTDGTLRTFKNSGGALTELTGAANPFNGFDAGAASAPAFADIDGDGDLDLIVGSGNDTVTQPNPPKGRVYTFLNNGNGTFTALPGTADPFNGIAAGDATSPQVIDVNGDGTPDLVVSQNVGNNAGTIQTYLGSKPSSTVVVTVTNPAPPTPVAPTLANDNGSSSMDGVTSDPTITYPTPTQGASLVYSTDGTNYSKSAPTFVTDGSQDGVKTVYIKQENGSGQRSGASSLTFTLDTGPTRPSTPVLSAAEDTGASSSDGITTVNTPTLTGTADANAPVAIYMDDAVLVGSGMADGSGHYSIMTSALPDGRHALYALSTDSYGIRKSGAAGFLYMTVEPSIATPTAPTVSHETNGVTPDKSPTLTGTAAPLSLVTLYDENNNAIAANYANSSGAYSIYPSTPLADGMHTLSVTASDAAGNVSGHSAGTSFTIDTAPPPPPSAPTIAGVPNNGFTADNDPTVTGTGTTGTTVTLYRDDAVAIGSAAVDNNGTYTITAGSALADGRHTLYTIATDAVGNTSMGVAGVTYVTVQTAQPTATAPLLEKGSDTGLRPGVTGQNAPDFIGKATAGATVTLYDTDGSTPLGSATAGPDGNYKIASSTLSDGTHKLTVIPTSTAGVVGQRSPTKTLTIDTTPPPAPTLTLDPNSDTGDQGDGMTSDNTPTFTGTTEANVRITLYADDATEIGGTIADRSGKFSVSSSTLDVGRHLIYATATDDGNNRSGPATTYLTITSMNNMVQAMAQMAPASSSAAMTSSASSSTPETTVVSSHAA